MTIAAQISLSSGSLFPSRIAALVFSFILILWVVSEVIGGMVQPLVLGGRRARRRGHDRGSFLLIYAGVIVYFIIAVSFAGSSVATLPSSTFYLGIFLMVLGIVVRQWAIAVLGRFFSRTLAVQEQQTVVETGPYRFVRHPSYTGALIFFVGFGLALQSWGSVLTLVPIFAICYGYRMYIEEELLVAELGEAYLSYSHSTKRLIPYVF
jgi:protein-S-isoprenylcysteine O-methyltransferase Ste14